MSEQKESALTPYRVLDLTEDGCLLAGRMLADLGADVIVIEKPGGSPSRLGPFYKNIPHPEKSLFWFAYCANKRGITLDIESFTGRELFYRLCRTADIIIESFNPGYMENLGLGYSDIAKIKPEIIMTSITWFGQTGPKAHYNACDLTAWASSGYLYICGDPDRAPVWISFPQARTKCGAEAVSGALTALWHRQMTGEGQHVDISIQECLVPSLLNTLSLWQIEGYEYVRTGTSVFSPLKGVKFGFTLPCKDGYIAITMMGGGTIGYVNHMNGMVNWMNEENMAPEWLKEIDWARDYDASKVSQELIDRVEHSFSEFTLTKTKKELYEEGMCRGLLIAPVSTAEELLNNIQLNTRAYWVTLEHPEIDEPLTYPGPFAILSETPITYRCRAPFIGEHNEEVYTELGVSKRELSLLKEARVI